MPENFLSRFTPSLMAPEVLEEIFVQREGLAARLVRQVRESVVGDEKHQRLIVGPRGIGKTHLVSLVYHRLRATEDLRDRMRVAWLREEEWGISSFLDLLVRILAALSDEDPNAGVRDRLSAIYALDGDAAEAATLALLSDVLGGRTLVLIVENLDEVFAGLGERGQQRLRAYLQNRRECAILATSQALFGAVWLESSPFFGFFQVTHLKEFDVDTARALLINLARFMGNEELAALLITPVGRSRLEALHHLVGGNPRLYVILAQFLTRESLDELVGAFFEALDELTPYYRERMKSLSPLQQKLVYLLSEAGAPVSVKILAERAFATQQTVSSQLKQLRTQRFVVAHTVGRESWYELREPLLRLVLRVKKERGEPVRLFVDFLRVWYSRGELTELLSALPPLSTEANYIQRALAVDNVGQSEAVQALVRAFNEALAASEWERAIELNDRILEFVDDAYVLVARGQVLAALNRAREAQDSVDEAVRRAPEDAFVAVLRAGVMAQIGRGEDARAILDTISTSAKEDPEVISLRAQVWMTADRPERALDDYRTLGKLYPEQADVYLGQGAALISMGRAIEALEVLSPWKDVLDGDTRFLSLYGTAASLAGRWEEAETLHLRRVELDPDAPLVWIELAAVYSQQGKFAEALSALDHTTPDASDPRVFFGLRGLALAELQRHEESIASFEQALSLEPSSEQVGSFVGAIITNLAWLGRWRAVLTRFTDALAGLETRSEPRLRLVGATVLALARQKESFWNEGVNELLARVDDDTDRLVLGSAVVSGVELLLRTRGTAAARRWLDSWVEASRQFAEINTGYRLADVAVRYRENPDERLLLGLPLEERKVVNTLLGIPEMEAGSGQ